MTLINRRGLHARAAAKMATVAERFAAQIDVIFDGESVPAASIMGLMLLGASCGSTLTLRGDGSDAASALDTLAGLIASGFDEGE